MATKKAGKYSRLALKGGGKSDIVLYAGPKTHGSWKAIAEKLEVADIGHLFNILEATLEEGKRLGRAEVMPHVLDMKRQVGKLVDGIERSTPYKKPGRPKKPTLK